MNKLRSHGYVTVAFRITYESILVERVNFIPQPHVKENGNQHI